MRRDWMEFVTKFGMASWSSTKYPCFMCDCEKGNMHNYKTASIQGLPWRCLTQVDYNSAIDKCEKHVSLSRTQHAEVKNFLEYDKRKEGAKGRAIVRSFPAVGLDKKDRLEPSITLPDVAQFESNLTFPLQLVWWDVLMRQGFGIEAQCFATCLGWGFIAFAWICFIVCIWAFLKTIVLPVYGCALPALCLPKTNHKKKSRCCCR